MSEKGFLKPAEGVLVRTEDGARRVKAEGERLPLTTYYRRRIMDGDLVEAVEPGSAEAQLGMSHRAARKETDKGRKD